MDECKPLASGDEVVDDGAVCGARIHALIAAAAPVAVDFKGVDLCRDHGRACQKLLASSRHLNLNLGGRSR